MLGRNAEIKMVISKKEYNSLIEKLMSEYGSEFEKREQIIYFADSHDLELFRKEKVLLRYRWNNQGLEVVVKKRNVDKNTIAKIDEKFRTLEDHSIKFEVDQVSRHAHTISCSLRHILPNIHQSFPFYRQPQELLSPSQVEFL